MPIISNIQYDKLALNARVWIYQSSRLFTSDEVQSIKTNLSAFAKDWTSHNAQLHAFGDLLFNRFIVLMVDESKTNASGCSIDKSVRFIQWVENTYQTEMFDRWNFAFRNQHGDVQTASKEAFQQAYRSGAINDQTIVFNNLVQTKAAFETSWQLPLAHSWHKNFVN